jgi:glycosyltransferase involved in cell wall biosynthesis
LSTSERPILLFLAQSLPYPPHSGVANRTFNILRQLQKEFAVHLVAFSRKDHQATPAERSLAQAVLGEQLSWVGAPALVEAEQSVVRRVWDHLRSLLTSRPYTDYEYLSDSFARSLAAAIDLGRPAMIHLDSLDLHHWRGSLPVAPVACTHHSIESELLRMQAGRVQPTVLQDYVRYQAGLVERVERTVCPKVDLNVVMSELDATRLQNLAPGSRTLVIPNGVDIQYFIPEEDAVQQEDRVVFVGPTYSFPNRDAVQHLVSDIWPSVLKARKGAALHLVGRQPEQDRIMFASQAGVTCQGHVEDLRPHLAAAKCCVVPIRVGGGTRLKILDAWAMGKAVVSTSIGCEGLDFIDGQNILVRDDPATFSAAVVEILENRELRVRLQEGGRRVAMKKYSWDTIGATLRGAYRALMAHH